jgi:hypothetical protein
MSKPRGFGGGRTRRKLIPDEPVAETVEEPVAEEPEADAPGESAAEAAGQGSAEEPQPRRRGRPPKEPPAPDEERATKKTTIMTTHTLTLDLDLVANALKRQTGRDDIDRSLLFRALGVAFLEAHKAGRLDLTGVEDELSLRRMLKKKLAR